MQNYFQQCSYPRGTKLPLSHTYDHTSPSRRWPGARAFTVTTGSTHSSMNINFMSTNQNCLSRVFTLLMSLLTFCVFSSCSHALVFLLVALLECSNSLFYANIRMCKITYCLWDLTFGPVIESYYVSMCLFMDMGHVMYCIFVCICTCV